MAQQLTDAADQPLALASGATDPSGSVALVRMAQEGDQRAFETLYRSRFDRIARYVGALLRRPDLTEDAVAETFLHVWRDLPKLREPVRFDAWLYRIAHRRAMAEIRRSRREQPLEPQHEPVDESRATAPDLALEAADEVGFVRDALNRLPERHREVLILRHLDERSHADVAGLLGISEEAARARYSRAARALRERIEGARP